MNAETVMTRRVVTTRPDAPVQEAARLLVEHRVSGLPVLDASGRLVGIVTEADLIQRQKAPAPRPAWWHRFLADPEKLAEEYRRAAGSTVGDVMTRGVICIDPQMPVSAIASLLARRGIKRVPVVAAGRLVGIVSRADLVKALATGVTTRGIAPDDAEVVRLIEDRLAREPWANRSGIVVRSHGGLVELWGLVESESEKAATAALAANVPGVKDVRSYLAVRSDVLPYVYWTEARAEPDDTTPAELRPGQDPWDPQNPVARP